ncbi:MAG: very short patch repair endonuclease [Sphaerochaeta sp.]|uniref:very short patch repair endonuclease n=1 Tax=unclassified Sphaerochaeta TaxID=2637943 RepID=UPI000EBDF040|nr:MULTISPECIES: very short patch repair endonuclease [unclassified Sphaerochaeta]MDX9824351.1 very short patch repair endonuclease [Sphaerochaeta sp.]MEA4864135.1 very short patch repair endonuclease [Sphaerochaeta sp.]HAP57581.1 very short patch repair endonuclease [Sphaerochaeta sp.]HCU30691.1 very short patch repair endonuclease [Sphaerochaeta sp.]
MSDCFSVEKRSRIMAGIKAKDTKAELAVRTFLFRQGFRYRIHDTRLPGKPDIVLPKYKTVIFINGCFWHAHQGCKHFTLPKTNRPFWEQKLLRNRERDQYVLASLLQMGYHVLVVWECELSPPARREETLLGLANEIWQAEG